MSDFKFKRVVDLSSTGVASPTGKGSNLEQRGHWVDGYLVSESCPFSLAADDKTKLQADLLLAKAESHDLRTRLEKIHKYATIDGKPGKGCIILGYPGIGKTSISRRITNCIDLESSLFSINSATNPEWYKAYCSIAIASASAGNIVFISSHKQVQDYLGHLYFNSVSEVNYDVYVCYPDVELADTWAVKLFRRYLKSHSDKDKRAFMRCIDKYKEDIGYLKQSKFKQIQIKSENYDLVDIIGALHIWQKLSNS